MEEGIDGLVHVSDLSWTKLVKHPKEILNKESFILCAFNLAYIAFNYKHNLRNHLSFFWPDGMFSYYLNQKKQPGRNFLKKLLLFSHTSK